MARKKTSKKKTSKSKAVGRPIAGLPADWKDQLRQDAKEESERTPVGTGNRISLKRNGQFAFQGADIGDSIDVVIVDHVAVKTWYEEEYDEDNPTPPSCFALKPNAKNIAPHENSPNKQSKTCEDCWANEWGSGRGRGKSCSDKNRLALLHSDDLEGDLILLESPVTSSANFNKYISSLTKAADLPCYAVLTRITMDEDADYQKLEFELIESLTKEALAGPFSKRKQAREICMEPYDTTGYEKPKKASKKKKTKKKGGRTAAKKKRRSRMS